MEKIKDFLTTNDGDGFGYGFGYGTGYGYGDGSGDGSGYGDGDGDGDGFGYGTGYGYGDGSGDGYDYGFGDGDGSGITNYNGEPVYLIDDLATIIKTVRRNIAKGFILNSDLTLTPCYVAKGHNLFAHGETIEKATQSLQEKIFANMDTDEAIYMFLKEFELDKKYPAKDFYVWHNRLTGSCEMGRNQFIKNGGYDLENDTFTVQEFIEITKNSFGGNVIKQLEQAIKERI